MPDEDKTLEQLANAAYRRSMPQKTQTKRPTRTKRAPNLHLDKASRERCKELLLEVIFGAINADTLKDHVHRTFQRPLDSEELLYINLVLMDRIILLLRGQQPGVQLPGGRIPGYTERLAAPPIKHIPRKHFGGTPESD